MLVHKAHVLHVLVPFISCVAEMIGLDLDHHPVPSTELLGCDHLVVVFLLPISPP